jgi:uncharacterized protein (UPF0128 family)
MTQIEQLQKLQQILKEMGCVHDWNTFHTYTEKDTGIIYIEKEKLFFCDWDESYHNGDVYNKETREIPLTDKLFKELRNQLISRITVEEGHRFREEQIKNEKTEVARRVRDLLLINDL